MNILLGLGLAMVVGLLLTRVAKLIHLPNVTAYLIGGLIVGPYCLGWLGGETNAEVLNAITSVALGFIAFSIGTSFKLKHIKEIGKSVLAITVFQALTTVLVVDAALLVLYFFELIELPAVFLFGAIATATAPAATLLVIRQYRARGIVTDTLLPVVAFDDAIGLVVFAVSLSIAKVIAYNEVLTFQTTVLVPLLEIVESLGIGAVLGFAMVLATRFFRSRANRICWCVAVVLIATALCTTWDLSNLLCCMMISAVYVNFNKESDKVFDLMDRWTYPIFMLFFVISGAELDLKVLPAVGLVGIVYIVARMVGKYFGAFAGAAVVKADKNVRNYLGFTLFPQAGVAIGMAQIVVTALPEYGAEVRAVTLCATLIYEIIGPIITKIALTRAGEIPSEKKPANTQTPPTAPEQ